MPRLKWRSRWSTWKHKHSYYSVPNFKANLDDMRVWCQNNFANNWEMYNHTWRFRFKKDYMLFLLRWT